LGSNKRINLPTLKNIKLEINEIKKIYSKIITLPAKEKIDTVNRIIQSFESGDTLEPVSYLSSHKDTKRELFLTEEPLEQKIKLQITYAAGIIPGVLTVIQSVTKSNETRYIDHLVVEKNLQPKDTGRCMKTILSSISNYLICGTRIW
jgi:hypothetical protein